MDLFHRHRWEIVQEFSDGFPGFKIVEKGLDRHAGPTEYWPPTENFTRRLNDGFSHQAIRDRKMPRISIQMTHRAPNKSSQRMPVYPAGSERSYLNAEIFH